MTKHIHLILAAAVVLLLSSVQSQSSWGRGFGGMHGGMRGGMGGMRGGMGGMRGGMGGMRGGMGGMSGIGGMRGGMGGMRGGMGGMSGIGGRGMGGIGGMRGGMGGMRGGMGMGGRPAATGLAQRGFPGGSPGGFGGRRPEAGANPFRRPDRGQLSNFLGMPSDGGMHALAGNRMGADRRGLARFPEGDMMRRGDYVRRDFDRRGWYSADWFHRYPGAWFPRTWAMGDIWTAETWAAMNSWFGYGNAQPIYYDYGNNVTYQDNSVYVDGQNAGTSDEYFQQAANLASAGAQTQPSDEEKWMPLGVFAMTHDDQNKANLILQLAVNKQGIIRGNYTATMTNDNKPVQGSVDKKTQRAAFTIGDNKDTVIETGIYNLTKDQAPALIHFGKEKTEQWLLVRMKDEEKQPQPADQ